LSSAHPAGIPDPESGYMVRHGKPKGFFYLDHSTVDGRRGIIIDTYGRPPSRLSRPARPPARALRSFDLPVRAVGLDAGYATSASPKGWRSAASSASPRPQQSPA
jgi:hypothetical protein